MIIVVMGVSGSGKSTVATLLAGALGCRFQEGDDLHPPENVEKMRSGTPLTDADRLPWLRKIAEEIDGWRARGECGVVTCSALKRSYRDIIIGDRPEVVLVYLKGSRDLIHQRMIARNEHFMPVALLDSQFATLSASALPSEGARYRRLQAPATNPAAPPDINPRRGRGNVARRQMPRNCRPWLSSGS